MESMECKLMDPTHDVWLTILQFMNWSSTHSLYDVSKGHRTLIDETDHVFSILVNLIMNIEGNNYYQTLQTVNEIMTKCNDKLTELLKLKLAQNTDLISRLLMPQIKKRQIITKNLSLTADIFNSTNLYHHFYQHLTTISDPKDNFEILILFGRLYGLKFIEFGEKDPRLSRFAYLLELQSNYGAIHEPSQILFWDKAVFDIFFNPVFYPSTSMDNLGVLIKDRIVSYLILNPIHFWCIIQYPIHHG